MSLQASIFQLLLSSPYPTVQELCQTDKTIGKLCHDETLWTLRLEKDMPWVVKPPGMKARDFYKIKAQGYFDTLFDNKAGVVYQRMFEKGESGMINIFKPDIPIPVMTSLVSGYPPSVLYNVFKIIPDVFITHKSEYNAFFVDEWYPKDYLVIRDLDKETSIDRRIIYQQQVENVSFDEAKAIADDLLAQGYKIAGNLGYLLKKPESIRWLDDQGVIELIPNEMQDENIADEARSVMRGYLIKRREEQQDEEEEYEDYEEQDNYN